MKTGPKTRPIPNLQLISSEKIVKPATSKEMARAGLPAAPDWMSVATLKEYRTTFAILKKRRIFLRTDCAAYLTMFEHLELAQRAYQQILSDGLTTIDERGLPRKSPNVQIYKDNSLAYLRYANEFGLTPSSRARQGSEIENLEEDEMERLLRGS